MNEDDDALKAGDEIAVLEVHMFGPDCWVPAEVIAVDDHRVGAIFMGGDSAGLLIALERSTENRYWKRTPAG
jgi:hypothetical protein